MRWNHRRCGLVVSSVLTTSHGLSTSTSILSPLSSSTVISTLKAPRILQYDTNAYPFQAIVSKILGLAPDHELQTLHLATPEASTTLTDKSGAKINYYQSLWNRDRDKSPTERGEAFMAFDELYRSFIREVIAPSIEGNDPRRLIFQRAPTLRVYPPGGETAMGAFHNDAQYHHQPSEINFWFPLSELVGGTNSLWVESAPGRGDYGPIELAYGECYRGYLNACRHGCQVNTSNATRVSIDFRCVSEALGGHDPTFRTGVRRGPKARFQDRFDIGGFYDLL